MPVLVAYASKHGSTQGIAERIAAIVPAGGLEVDLVAAEDAGDPADYDAFVTGSAVYASRWLAPASEFVQHNRALLAARPVWLFSIGPEHLIRLFLPQGDFPAWPDIEAWAADIARELRRTRPPPTPGRAGRDRSRLEGL